MQLTENVVHSVPILSVALINLIINMVGLPECTCSNDTVYKKLGTLC